MELVMLQALKYLLSRTHLPGRYIAADLVARLYSLRCSQVKGQIGGYTYKFDFSDELQRQMYFGLYDNDEVRLLTSILQPGDVFIDVGANVGFYTLWASWLVGPEGQVHAFEPIPANLQKINSAIHQNNIRNVYTNQFAVGDAQGILNLNVDAQNLGNSGWASIVPSERRPKVVTVQQVTLNHYVEQRGIETVRTIKLDIEGAEPEAISGMRSLIDRFDAPDILCELNPWLLQKRNLDTTAITLPLARHGYQLFAITKSGFIEIDASFRISKLINIHARKHPQC